MDLLGVLLLLMAGTALAASAAGEPEVLFEEQRLVAPAAEEVAFDLPAPPAGRQVRLSLTARVDTPSFGGHNPFLGLAVNGQVVAPERLLNKPLEFTMNDGSDASWWGQGRWRVLYSPGFDAFFRDDPPAYMVADADPYGFVWDITPYVQPGRNTLTLSHPKLLVQPTTLVVGRAAVEVGEPLEPPAAVGAAPDAPLPTIEPSAPSSAALAADLAPDGALRVRLGEHALLVRTRTSLPDGRWVSGAAQWRGDGYRVERTVTVRGSHVHVADTFTNTTDRLVGVIVEHRLDLAAQPQAERRLAGRRVYRPNQTLAAPANPTAIAWWPGAAVGLVAEDDVLRVHSELFSEPGAVGLADRRLGLAPGASHTLEWSLYALPGGDYWDVINAIRRDWGANFTLPGPGAFEQQPDGSRTAEEYGRWARSRTLAFAMSGQQVLDDGMLAEGTAIPLATKWNEGFRVWLAKLRQAAPGCRALVYLHSGISTEPGAPEKYAECRLLDAAGNHAVSPYHYPVYLHVPRPDNAYGQALSRTVEFILDDLDADGIFNDCFTHDTHAWTWGGAWDGCTVAIDPATHAGTGPYSSVVLLQQPWKEWLVAACRRRGKLLVGNGALFTRTMLRLKVPSFSETSSFAHVIDTHLGAPWGLGTHDSEQTMRARVHMARRMLDNGAVYLVYNWLDDPAEEPFVRWFYPFTPLELHPGVLIGEERILTNRSGRFGWGDAGGAEVLAWDAEGRQVEATSREAVADGRRLTEVTVPDGGLAVLVRRGR